VVKGSTHWLMLSYSKVWAASRWLRRGSVPTLTASVIALLILSQVAAALVYAVSSWSKYILDVAGALARASSADVRVYRAPNGSIVLESNVQVRVVGSYLVTNGSIVKGLGGGVIDGKLVLPQLGQSADELLLILEGGKLLKVPLNSLGSTASAVSLLDNLGYKVAVGLLTNYESYISNGPIHTRYAVSQPPSSADLGYKPILQGNVVFYFTGLTFGIASGNYWEVSGGVITVYPNRAVYSTGVSPNPAAISQVFKVVKGGGGVRLPVKISVRLTNTSITSSYPRIAVVCYVLDNDADLQLPVAIFQPPALGHLPWAGRKVLYLSSPGQVGVDYSGYVELSDLPEESYILIGVEVLSYGLSTGVAVGISFGG